MAPEGRFTTVLTNLAENELMRIEFLQLLKQLLLEFTR